MGTGEIIACVTLGMGLLAYAWRAGGVSSTFEAGMKALTTQCEKLEKKNEELEEKLERVEKIPEHERRIGALESLANAQSETIHKTLRPGLVQVSEQVKALDHRVNSIKGMPAVRGRYGSRPDFGGDDE